MDWMGHWSYFKFCFRRAAARLDPDNGALAFAALGAGVIATVAVAQGQNPLTALGITVFSAVAAVMVGQVL